MATTVDIGTLITRTPGVVGGRLCIAGTRVSVMRIAIYYQLGKTPEEIAVIYDHIDLAQVYAALAYYHANREEIDADIEEEEKIADELERNARAGRR